MENEQLSDLAKSILAGERITPSTGIPLSPASSTNGIPVPKGGVPISEGIDFISHSDGYTPTGSIFIQYSKNEEESDS